MCYCFSWPVLYEVLYLSRLNSIYSKNSSYILFCQSPTHVDATELLKMLEKYAPKQVKATPSQEKHTQKKMSVSSMFH